MDEVVERVRSVVTAIPEGRVLTYGDVAALAGSTTAREVGEVLARHGDGLPWWRVLRADGTPAPHLRERQLERLRREGTPVGPSGDAVDLRRARWRAARGGDDQPTLFD
jgi:methylated-DNA-protein-cysteine methyltransferase related protein